MTNHASIKQRGLTLIEVILVLAIGAAMILLGIRQYQTFRLDADVRQVQANVDTIFQAMNAFYQANCGARFNPSTQSYTPGRLNPTATPAPTNPFPVDIAVDLITPGLLTMPLPISPLVDATGPGTDGYVAQFNRTDQTRFVCSAGSGAINTLSNPPCTTRSAIGTSVIWMAQVAVNLQNPAAADQFARLLNADCLSSAAGSGIAPCSASSTGNYVVWQRLPGGATTNYIRDSWEQNPSVNQFTQMYTTYPSGYLINTGGQMPLNQPQYFLCGGS